MSTRYGQEPGTPPTPRPDDDDTDKPDLVAVFEHYNVIVNKSMVSCPLHEDRTPSCSVNKGKGVWNCHSCGKAGDVWTLIQLKEGVDYLGARTFAATIGFADGGTGNGGGDVRKSAYARRRDLPLQPGDQRGGGGYVPSWHRR